VEVCAILTQKKGGIMLRKKTNNLVKKTNELAIMKKDSLNIREAKVIAYLISMIQTESESLQKHKIPLTALCEEININYKDMANVADEFSQELLNKKIKIGTGPEEWAWAQWVSWFYYKDGMVTLGLNPDLKPYLTKLSEKFFNYRIENLLFLTTGYAVTLYELLKYWQGNIYEIDLDKFHDIFGTGKIKSYNSSKATYNIKVRIIEPAIEQINKFTDITVTKWERIKLGRRVIGFRFFKRKNESPYWATEDYRREQQALALEGEKVFESTPKEYLQGILAGTAYRLDKFQVDLMGGNLLLRGPEEVLITALGDESVKGTDREKIVSEAKKYGYATIFEVDPRI